MANRLEISYKKPGSNSNDIIVEENIDGDAAVSYDGDNIATVGTGETKTLQCSGKLMRTNVVVADKVLNCAGKKMNSNIVIKLKSSSNQYALTIEMDPPTSVTANDQIASNGDVFTFSEGERVQISATMVSDLYELDGITVTKEADGSSIHYVASNDSCTAVIVMDGNYTAKIKTIRAGMG